MKPRQAKRGRSSMWTAGTAKPEGPGGDKLGEGFEAVEGAIDRGGFEDRALGSDIQGVGFVLAERGAGVAGCRAFHFQGYRCRRVERNAGLLRQARAETCDSGVQTRLGGAGGLDTEVGIYSQVSGTYIHPDRPWHKSRGCLRACDERTKQEKS